MKVKKQSHFGIQEKYDSSLYSVLPDTLISEKERIIAGDVFHTIIAIREYPIYTERHGILGELGRLEGVNLKIYIDRVSDGESRNILKNSQRRNGMLKQSGNIKSKLEGDMLDSDLSSMLRSMREKGQIFLYVTVIIDLSSDSEEKLENLFDKVSFILTSNDITFSRLRFRQEDGYLSSLAFGSNRFENDFKRVLPCISTSNLYPFSYFGKYDSSGFYIGTDDCGGDVIDDISSSDDEKTNSNVLIMGNSGMGKSYLSKLLCINLLESGKNILIFDPENEYEKLTENLSGTSISVSSGGVCMNPMEIKRADNGEYDYKGQTAFLLDLFGILCSLDKNELSVLETFIHRTYEKCGIFENMIPEKPNFPTFGMLYDNIKGEYIRYKENEGLVYTKEDLSKLCISLYPVCKGIYSMYFTGKPGDMSANIVRFCLKDIFALKGNIREGILFNILSFAENVLLEKGNTVLLIDELYLFLENRISIESIRSCIKRVRKRNSLLILATQNISDLLLPEIQEYTKPLLAIPQRRFLFSPGNVDKERYMDLLDISPIEYSHIHNAKRGRCIYKCGGETFVMDVCAPKYKEEVFM